MYTLSLDTLSEVLFKHCILRLYLHNLPVQTPRRVSEVEEAMAAGVMTPLDRRGTALGCFVLARCLQLGQVVSRNEQKADEYFTKVYTRRVHSTTDLWESVWQITNDRNCKEWVMRLCNPRVCGYPEVKPRDKCKQVGYSA